jgi:Transcriptional regulator
MEPSQAQEGHVNQKYFLLAFAVGFLLFSTAFFCMSRFILPRSGAPVALSLPEVAEPAYRATADDCLTVLLVGLPAARQEPALYLLVRVDPLRGGMPVTVVPAETLVRNNGTGETLADIYQYGGIETTVSALSSALEIPIDRYFRLDADSLAQCLDWTGAAAFLLPQDVRFEKDEKSTLLQQGVQMLDGKKMVQMVYYNSFEGGAPARCQWVAEMAASYLNQRRNVVLEAAADRIFEEIVNAADTNMNAPDFINRKPALEQLARLSGAPAVALTLAGSYNESGQFVLSDTFRAVVVQTFGAGWIPGQADRSK